VDKENDPDVASMIGASAALEISDIPFKGPIAGVRVGRINGELVANESPEKMKESEMNLFLVGRKVTPGKSGRPYDVELVMMEGEAKEVPERLLLMLLISDWKLSGLLLICRIR